MTRPSQTSGTNVVHVRTFANDVAELRRLSAWFRECALASQVSQEVSLDAELCLNEAVANIIRYGYADGGRHDIRIAFERSAGGIDLTIDDDGRPFDPLDVPPLAIADSIEQLPTGGRGVHLMRTLADDVQYQREDGHNVLVLTFRIGARAPQ